MKRAKRWGASAVGARFIEPMLCLAVDKLPEGPAWQYEVKLDGYRAIAARTKTGVELWSRNKKDFSRRFTKIARALEALPVETVLDGEIVAVNGDGQPSFSSLQNSREMALRHDFLLRLRCTGAGRRRLCAASRWRLVVRCFAN